MLMNFIGFIIYLIGASGILVLTNYKDLGENDLLFTVSLLALVVWCFIPRLNIGLTGLENNLMKKNYEL